MASPPYGSPPHSPTSPSIRADFPPLPYSHVVGAYDDRRPSPTSSPPLSPYLVDPSPSPASPLLMGPEDYSPTSPLDTPLSQRQRFPWHYYYSAASPYYSPTSPGGHGAYYPPTSPGYSPASPYYVPHSPCYPPTSHLYSPTSPTYYCPDTPVCNPRSAIYSPSSPSYRPEFDHGEHTSPAPESPANGVEPPTSPEYCYCCSTPLEDCCCPHPGDDAPAP